MYVLPEEVGARTYIIGRNLLAIYDTSDKRPGCIDIFNPIYSDTIISWERDKIRRTGYIGNLVFIEIGRRCRGGPGLVWLYVRPKEAHDLREALHRYVQNLNQSRVCTCVYNDTILSVLSVINVFVLGNHLVCACLFSSIPRVSVKPGLPGEWAIKFIDIHSNLCITNSAFKPKLLHIPNTKIAIGMS